MKLRLLLQCFFFVFCLFVEGQIYKSRSELYIKQQKILTPQIKTKMFNPYLVEQFCMGADENTQVLLCKSVCNFMGSKLMCAGGLVISTTDYRPGDVWFNSPWGQP